MPFLVFALVLVYGLYNEEYYGAGVLDNPPKRSQVALQLLG